MVYRGSKSQSTITQPQHTPRPTPRDVFPSNWPRTGQGKPAREPRATTLRSAVLSLRMPCKHIMKDSYSESRHERPILQPRLHLNSASKCLSWSTLTVVAATIDGIALQTTCEGTAGSGGSRTSHAAPGWGRANPHRTSEVMRTVVMQTFVARTHPASPRGELFEPTPQCPGSTSRQTVST